MFKNLSIYRIANNAGLALAALEEALQKTHFTPCGATQEKSSGRVPPRGEEHGLLHSLVGRAYQLTTGLLCNIVIQVRYKRYNLQFK